MVNKTESAFKDLRGLKGMLMGQCKGTATKVTKCGCSGPSSANQLRDWQESSRRFSCDLQGQEKESNGPQGPEPTRYGDWERKGRCSDF